MRQGKFAELAERVEDQCTVWGIDDFLRSSAALLKLLALLLYVCHLFACIFVLIADHEPPAGDTNWYRSLGLCDDLPEGEPVAPCLPELYTTALYWAVTTMTTVGYGDITPTSDGEKKFFMVAMMLGGAYFAYMIALMTDVVTKQDPNQTAFNEKIEGVRAYCVAMQLPRDLQVRVVKFYKHAMRERSAFDGGALLEDMSPFLRNEVALRLSEDMPVDLLPDPVRPKTRRATIIA